MRTLPAVLVLVLLGAPAPAPAQQKVRYLTANQIQPGATGEFTLVSFKVFQVIDDETMLLYYLSARSKAEWSKLLMLKGHPTKNFVDDQFLGQRNFGLVRISTTRYETAAGSTKTVLLAEVIKPEKKQKK